MSDDADFQRQMLAKMALMIEGVRALTERAGATTDKVGRFEAEFERISRQNHSLRQELLNVRSDAHQFRSDVISRLDALAARFDELENTVDRNSSGVRELSLDSMSHFNSILTALQDSTNSHLSIRELHERVDALERRMGM